MKQLQAQLEEASAHQQLTTKSKKSIQFENEDLQNQIEEISIAKQEIERQLTDSLRERYFLNYSCKRHCLPLFLDMNFVIVLKNRKMN